MQVNTTTQAMTMLYELEIVDDAFCDIIQDQYRYLTPQVLRSLEAAIDRLHAWREEHGMTYTP